MRRVGLLCALLAGGCRFTVDYGGTSYQCVDTADCPSGQECVVDHCSDAPGVPDAATPDPSDAAVAIDAVPGTPDATPMPPDAAWPPNTLPDPDMEGGGLGWDTYLASPIPSGTDPHSGLMALKICKDPDGSTGYISVYADIENGLNPGEIPAGTHYHATVWVRASHMVGELPPPLLHMSIRERGGALPYEDHFGPTIAPITETWVQLEADALITASDRTGVTVIVSPEDVVDDTCYVIDDAYGARF